MSVTSFAGEITVTTSPQTVPLSDISLHRFKDFLGIIAGQTYPEAPSELHETVTRIMMEQVLQSCPIGKTGRILDVGCGQGPALDVMREKGLQAVGITINDEDLRICREKGHEVLDMDQSFLDFRDGEFDLVWARHCIEHSIFPMFTLSGFHRVLKNGGMLYVEVPAPDTMFHHERNLNHYSVFTKSAWASLLNRSGFRIAWDNNFDFPLRDGPDTYYMFVCEKVP
jgi:SAM-dependent methyltransferase